MTAPARPVLRWHGGKWRLAPWIVAHFPPHRVYVEPFGGAASVLLRKERAYAEVYNDLDDDAVNLFRVLRAPDLAATLIEQLRLTPFARAEFVAANAATGEPVERARRLVVRSFMGFGSNSHASSEGAKRSGLRAHRRVTTSLAVVSDAGYRSTGFRANSSRSGTTPAHDWARYPEALRAIVERLAGVTIEHRDACEVMAQHDAPDTLHYVDPPYLPETRAPSNKAGLRRMYVHEMTPAAHRRLLAVLPGLCGMVALSGYPAPLYDAALFGWRRLATRAYADGARERTEVLWLNPACAAALDAATAQQALPLDAVSAPHPDPLPASTSAVADVELKKSGEREEARA